MLIWLLISVNMGSARKLSILVLVLTLWFFLTSSMVYAQQCDTIPDIVENKDFCHRQYVEVEGIAKDIQHKTSTKGNKYTTFDLEDNGKEVAVFSWGHFSVSPGDRVFLEGTYHKTKTVGSYTFYNEIKNESRTK